MNGRHIFGWLWNIFKNSLGSFKQKTEVVGRDHLGNTYYEKFAGKKTKCFFCKVR